MASVQKSIWLPEEAVKDIESLAENTGKDFSGPARDLLLEPIRMRKCLGLSLRTVPRAGVLESPVPESMFGN